MITLIKNNSTELSTITIPCEEISLYKGKPTKISVIVPVYNAENLVDQTLTSIRQQTLKDIEIICINDGSSDSSLNVLQAHLKEDSRISILNKQYNSGTGETINLGLMLSSGTYIQIVGNDDKLTPCALEKLYAFCESKHLDFCQYGVQIINDDPSDKTLAKREQHQEKHHRVAHKYPILPGPELICLLTENNEYRMHNGAQIVKKSLLDQHGIRNLEGIHHEDMYYTYRIFLSAQHATLISDPFYIYRIHHNSLESAKSSRIYTSEEFLSLLVSAAAMIDATPEDLFLSPKFSPVVEKEIYRFLGMATKRFASLSEENKKEIRLNSKTETSLFYLIDLYAKEYERSLLEIRKIKGSRSYRLGHALLAGPRRIKKFLDRR